MDTHVNEIDANLNAAGLRFALLVSRFNDFITSRLLAGAQDTLLRHGAARDQLTIVHGPSIETVGRGSSSVVSAANVTDLWGLENNAAGGETFFLAANGHRAVLFEFPRFFDGSSQ